MPVGTGSQALRNVPLVPFSTDPNTFRQMTTRKAFQAFSKADLGDTGGTFTEELPAAGILAWVTAVFKGTLTTVKGTGVVTPNRRWPYGLLDDGNLSANFQNGLIDVVGEDLHVHRLTVNPAFEDNTDDFAGAVGGGSALADVTADPLHLTWQFPIVMDRTTLVGALYAQSAQTTLPLKITQAADNDLFTLTNDAAVTVSGTWYINVDYFDIPSSADAGIITPDLSRLHLLQGFEVPLSATGETEVPLIRQNGQLLRLFIQVREDATTITDPTPANQPNWTGVSLKYGGAEKPQDWPTIETLLARNNEHYGARLPYGYICLDWAREDAMRDAVLMQGVTDLRVAVDLDSTVSVSAGKIRVVQEMLIS